MPRDDYGTDGNLPGVVPVPRIVKEKRDAKKGVLPVTISHKLVRQGPRILRGSRERLSFGDGRTLVSLQEPGGDPTLIGVQLSLTTVDPLALVPTDISTEVGGAPNSTAFAAIGVAEWGVDGASHTAQFDARDGLSLGFLANSLKISVFHIRLFPGGGTPGPIDVFAGCALGSVFPGNIKPQRTFELTFAAPGAASIFVPKFARTVDVCRAPDTAAFTLEFRRGLFVPPAPVECEVNVAGGAQLGREITLGDYGLLTLTAAAASEVSVIFGLDI